MVAMENVHVVDSEEDEEKEKETSKEEDIHQE